MDKDKKKLIKKKYSNLEVTDFSGNEVVVIRHAYYWVSLSRDRARRRKKFLVINGVETEELLIRVETLKSLGIVSDSYPNPNPQKFLASNPGILEQVKQKIKFLSKNADNSPVTQSTRKNEKKNC